MIAITFITALLIELIGTYISVIGLTALFGVNWVIAAMAISLDAGKILIVSLLYTHWRALPKLMRAYAFTAALITMTITSAGASAYLSGEFQKAIIGTQEVGLKVDVLKEQQAKYEERKKQIDQQIAALPEKTSVGQRIRLINAFKAEQAELQRKITEIDQQLPELQIKQIGVEAKAGPILYIAKAFDVSVEQAVKWVILMIIFVFDPLAVFLIVAGNFLMDQRKKSKPEENAYPDKMVASQQMPPELHESQPPLFEVLEPTPQVTPVALEPEEVELTTDEEAEPQSTPVVAEPMPQQRQQITLDDLRPVHRSTLHDVRGDATVTFDQNPRTSNNVDFYSKQ